MGDGQADRRIIMLHIVRGTAVDENGWSYARRVDLVNPTTTHTCVGIVFTVRIAGWLCSEENLDLIDVR